MTDKKKPKTIENIQALSFDLDDTLYDNPPVIKNAFFALYQYLLEHYPNIKKNFNFDEFLSAAYHLKQDQSRISDLTKLRYLHIKQVLNKSGYKQPRLDDAFNVFWQARQRVELYPGVIEILAQLSRRFPMVSISNGNACIKAIGIDRFFQTSIMVSDRYKPKPHNSMFLAACKNLAIQPQQLLHIGDCLEKDINGAHAAGCRSIWLNVHREVVNKTNADAVIEDLSDLLLPDFF